MSDKEKKDQTQNQKDEKLTTEQFAEHYSFEQLRKRYEDKTAFVIIKAELTTDMVGGMTAGPEGVDNFVRHYLKLEGQAATDAISRILREEMVGEQDVPTEEGEIKEKLSYSINIVRRHQVHGPWVKDHMVKAMLKNAATRDNLFSTSRGSKGCIAEMGEARAHGISLVEPDFPQRIYLRNQEGTGAAETYFNKFKGRIQTPQGPKSIVNDCECVKPGARFELGYRYSPMKVTKDNILEMFSSSMVIGLGSAKSFECGKFKIVDLAFIDAVMKQESKAKATPKAKAGAGAGEKEKVVIDGEEEDGAAAAIA